MTVTRPPQSHTAIKAELQTSLANARAEAEGIAGAATFIANAITEALTNGGQVSAQTQTAFLTGAFVRLVKDLAVAEHLQRHGAAAQRRALLRRRG